VPHSSVSLLLGFSAMLSVSLVSRVTARSLHDNNHSITESNAYIVQTSIAVGLTRETVLNAIW